MRLGMTFKSFKFHHIDTVFYLNKKLLILVQIDRQIYAEKFLSLSYD